MADRINAWKERLQSLTELQLPTDYPRSVPLKIVEAVEALQLSEATCLAILQLSLAIKVNTENAQLEHPSPFSILLAAFAVLLHRYTGEEDIPVGSSSDSRNPLVLRLTVKGTDTFEEVVQMVQKVEEQAAKIEVPFGALLSQLYQEQENSSNPLFKVRFFNQTDTDTNTITETTSTNDLTIFITSSSTSLRRLIPGIEVKVSYNQVLFSPSRIQHILDQLVLVLESAAANKSVQVGTMDLISERCRSVIPDPTADLNWCQWQGAITDIFTRNANSFPERTCIVESLLESSSSTSLTQTTRVRRFTYEHIYKAANTVAHYLVQNGLEREDVVMIYAYRGVDLVVAIIGTLMAGGTFSVIDPAYPPARQQIYLSVAQPRALVVLKHAGSLHPTVREYIDSELSIKCEIPALELFDDGHLSGGSDEDADDILEPVRGCASTSLDIVLGPDSIGTLSFTSGSTGIPKGVRGRHFSLTHFYPWMSQEFSLSNEDHFTMLSGIAHDPIQRDIFTPLFLGAELHIPTSEDIGIPGRLAEWMAEHEISVTHLTPAMGQLLSANATTPIPSLRNSFFVGDILTKRDCNRLQHLAPNATIINMYGTTETQRAVSYFAIPPRATHPSFLTSTKDIMPAGRGMRSVQLLVVNRLGKGLCGVGEVGEIYVRSGGLSEGYLKLEEVTNEKFLTNWFGSPSLHNGNSDLPFFKGPRDRMYRTGDLGRYKPDGCVECTGRADDQIKIRGFRIELGEIDTHLSQHPLVRENVTLVRRDKNEEQTLVSYFVPMENAEGFSTDEETVSSGQPRKYTRLIRDIREWLKKKLPSYSVPSVFVPLKKMPLTPNGKVDKPALPFPDTAQTAPVTQTGNSALELTPTQKLIHDIWRSILNQASISIDDNFFDIGGHSILATRMIFDVRKKCGVDVPLGLVFREPTIRGMSKEVEAIKNEDLNLPDNSDATPDQPSGNEDAQTVNYSHDFDELVKLLPSYAPLEQFPVQENKTTHFFLTGATGFLGAFILAEILRVLPNSKVHCLVRCKDEESGFERIKKNCEAHLVWKESWGQAGNENVLAVKGDLNMENLGIGQEKWAELTQVVDIIIHNGALVHWVYPYQKLRAANVIGTLEALRLASEHKTKSLHFVSSTSVLDSDHYIQLSTTGTPVSENDDLEGSRTGLQTGYGQSKWVSEKLIMEARKRGLPATIIRPGYVVGDSEIGVTNTDDFLWRLVKGCIQLGEVPIMNNIVNMCPVDYVAGTVVAVATQEKCLQRVAYHTTNPHRFRFNDMFASLMQYGFDVKPVEYILWRNHLMDVTLSANSDNALYPLLHFVLDDLPTSSKSPELDDTNTNWSIANTSVKCASMDTLMGLYLAYLIKVGFLELPELSEDQKSQVKTLPTLKRDVTMISRSGN
ncbi:L-aminoadipate-semialdehyde dehydrogenase [Basidiobolus meristosporus CBS 931.73]|uniref:Alpha-aminoadipate reductase n=1 Tax=Basidiobolus meristosporus CBS 931.73 TaxID=1314790 RepID=A0A1Y1Y954_9FUNG|nr:L-aminoadipate-semialdehyde dehydrogenase [Basidiobolus meristosporus CBS 931.73]|eukprot:ORX94094.1 L-aminoadipate-semialdehyde dehydrogenase [Basidiobolus meristosporus CBS 931.73]